MSRQTPRKARHSRQPSNRIPAISDYESDAATASAAAAAAAPQSYPAPPLRTNTELNLGVLRRYVPSITTILSIAANAVVYTIDISTAKWVKSSYEGTMFVCAQQPLPTDPAQRHRACVFVLSRKGLSNVVIDLAAVSHAESGELISLQIDSSNPAGVGQGQEHGQLVLGIWIHNDKEDTRERNWNAMRECWQVVRPEGVVGQQDVDVGPATLAVGRQLSLNELFAKQGSAVPA